MKPSARSRKDLGAPVAVALASLVGGGVLVLLDRLHPTVWWFQLGASVVGFAAYGIDKSAARRGGRRIPEARLHLIDLLGGWPGSLLARHLFRHKTVKQPFRTIFWLTVAANIALVGVAVFVLEV